MGVRVKISVLVPAYNEEKHLGACLRSLRAQTVGCEIVVCDNNSKDSTYEIAKRYADVVVAEKRQGVAHAFNAAVKASSGDLLAFTGADSLAYPGWIEKFLPHFADPRMVACYGPLEGLERRNYWPFRMFSQMERLGIRMKMSWVISGANSMIRRDAVVRAGCFDARFNMLEDCLLFSKIRKYGGVKFIADNPIRTSIRRVDELGTVKLFAKLFKESLKLRTVRKVKDEHFLPIR